MAHRPAYPQTLYDIVSEYHRSHGGKFDSALDVGGGIGIITREFLLERFAHVTLSDYSESYISQAKKFFASIPDPKKLSFVTSKIEDLKPADLPNGPVDLLTAGVCLHWADPLQITPSAAQLIKPGGSFSAWVYGGQPVLSEPNPPVQKAFDDVFRRFNTMHEENMLGKDGPLASVNARFDNVPFDPKEWSDVRRIKVMPEVTMLQVDNLPSADSRVLPGVESQEVLDNPKFISRKADYEWLVGYVKSLVPSLDVQGSFAAEFQELKNALGDGEVELSWPFGLVLATRR